MSFQRLCFESVTAAYILSIAFCLQWNIVASMGAMNKDVITLTLVNKSLSVERGILQDVPNRTITVFEGSNLTFQCSNTNHIGAPLGWTVFLGNVLHEREVFKIATPTFSLREVVYPSILEVHSLSSIENNNRDSYVLCGLPDYTGGPGSYSFASHRATIHVQGFPMCPRFENRVSPDNVSWTDNTVGPLSVYYTVAVNSTDGVSMYNVTESTFSIPVNISQSNSSYSLKVEACVLGHCSPNCPWRDYSDDDDSIVQKGPSLTGASQSVIVPVVVVLMVALGIGIIVIIVIIIACWIKTRRTRSKTAKIGSEKSNNSHFGNSIVVASQDSSKGVAGIPFPSSTTSGCMPGEYDNVTYSKPGDRGKVATTTVPTAAQHSANGNASPASGMQVDSAPKKLPPKSSNAVNAPCEYSLVSDCVPKSLLKPKSSPASCSNTGVNTTLLAPTSQPGSPEVFDAGYASLPHVTTKSGKPFKVRSSRKGEQ